MVIAIVLLSVYGYLTLPMFIPIRFDNMGKAQGMWAKWVVFAFPLVAIITYALVHLLVIYVYSPNKVKYNIKLMALYEASSSLMQLMRLAILVVIFLTLTLIIVGSINFCDVFGLGYKITIGGLLSLPLLWYFNEVIRK